MSSQRRSAFSFAALPSVGWPSGLRRQFKALVSSEAWVRIPLQSVFCLHFGLGVCNPPVGRSDNWSGSRFATAFIAQLGERQTEDLKVPSSILGEGTLLFLFSSKRRTIRQTLVSASSAPAQEAVPYSLVGQDTWFSPTRPGFDSRWGNFLFAPPLRPRVPHWCLWTRCAIKSTPTGSMAEWLRRLIRNQLGVARGSSNLSAVAFFWQGDSIFFCGGGAKS